LQNENPQFCKLEIPRIAKWPLKEEHQWGQTYTFDKMWIIDRRLLTLGKYDLNILRKTIKSTSVPEPFRMRFEIRGPVALILDY
jgi:hypothetical protein